MFCVLAQLLVVCAYAEQLYTFSSTFSNGHCMLPFEVQTYMANVHRGNLKMESEPLYAKAYITKFTLLVLPL